MVRLYGSFIDYWLRRLSVRTEVVPDVRPDIMLLLVEQLPQFQHNGQPGAFRSWLRTVTTNRVRQTIPSRRESRQLQQTDLAQTGSQRD